MTKKLLILPFMILASLSGCKKELPNEVDSKEPSVTIVSPINGSEMHADTSCTIVAEANDENGVASVEFLVDGEKIGTSTEAPYRMQMSMTGMTGSHSIAATAYDKAGNVGRSPAIAVLVIAPSTDTTGGDVPSYQSYFDNPDPADGATNIPYTCNFFCYHNKPDSVTVVYDFYLDTLAAPVRRVASNLTHPQQYGVPLLPATKYYWKIIATDSHGAKTRGPVWSFSTQPVFLPKGVSVASMTDNSVSFTWLDATVANYNYLIEQRDDDGTYRPIKTAGPGLTGTVCPGSFVVGKTYQFRIKTLMDSKSSEYVYLQYLYEQPRTFEYPLAIGTSWEYAFNSVYNNYRGGTPYGTFRTTHGTHIWTVASNVKTSDTIWYATIVRNSIDTTRVITVEYDSAGAGQMFPTKRDTSVSITTKIDTVSIITYPDQYAVSIPGFFNLYNMTIPRQLLTGRDTVSIYSTYEGSPVSQSVNNVGLIHLANGRGPSNTLWIMDEYTLRQFKRQ